MHNLVIVAPGALAEIGVVGSQMLPDSENWAGYRFVPNSNKVLFATRVLNSGESDTITIVAPEVVGEYPYLCTYPGHWVSMNGILHVVEDVNAWIAANPVKATGSDPTARALVNAWQLDDLVKDLDKLERGRSLARGRELFTAARCDVCHRVGKVGELIGPDLAEVTKRLKPVEMLAEILAPSTTINEQYRSWSVILDDGVVLTGLITKQDSEAIHIVQNPLASAEPIKISRDRIEAMKSSKVSTMPMGLLNTLTREEILDLLAYARSGGSPNP
jgi:putative heme-binding domain-containing protein